MSGEAFETLAENGRFSLRQAANEAARTRLLQFIRARFHERFGASVSDDTPALVGAFDRNGTLVGAFGLRDAASGYFCQHYLTAPLGTALQTSFGASGSAVEITHLCSARAGCLRELLELLPGWLLAGGHRYLVCTATACLAAFFTRRGLRAVSLAVASAAALPAEQQQQWGSYYEAEPRVLAGDLLDAAHRLTATGHDRQAVA